MNELQTYDQGPLPLQNTDDLFIGCVWLWFWGSHIGRGYMIFFIGVDHSILQGDKIEDHWKDNFTLFKIWSTMVKIQPQLCRSVSVSSVYLHAGASRCALIPLWHSIPSLAFTAAQRVIDVWAKPSALLWSSFGLKVTKNWPHFHDLQIAREEMAWGPGWLWWRPPPGSSLSSRFVGQILANLPIQPISHTRSR